MSKELSSIPLSVEVLSRTPPEAISLIQKLLERVIELEVQVLQLKKSNAELEKRIKELESRLNRKSSNSNQPPSSDSPYKSKIKESGPPSPKPWRKGYGRKMLEPTVVHNIIPEACSCGCTTLGESTPYYRHQEIELPKIELIVEEFVLHQAKCPECGKIVKAQVPSEHRTGYGPRLSAMVVELTGVHGDSRRAVQDFLFSVLGLSVSQGAIQKIVQRASEAISAHYQAIASATRQAPVNYIDETSWKTNGVLCWLWTMTSTLFSFFMIHKHRSRAAFEELVGTWQGLLVSDGYGLYRKWVYGRQSCLAHLIRRAVGVSEDSDPNIAAVGNTIAQLLRQLCHMAKSPPDIATWNGFYERLMRIFRINTEYDDDAGSLVRHLMREIDSLWTFLDAHGVEPTNNRAERALRFGVQYRKRSFGTRQQCGERFVERILSLRQTCRLQMRRTFPVLVDAFSAYFLKSPPDISCFAPHTP